MAKKKYRRTAAGISAYAARAELVNLYRERFYNIWMGAWEFEGLNRQQSDFLMKKLWEDGRIAAFDIIRGMTPFMGGLSPAKEGDNGLLGFAPFAEETFNMFGFPAKVNLINIRGTPYVPSGSMVVGKDVVLGWVLKSRVSLSSVIEIYIQKIVDVEMTIRTNLIGHKVPFVLECEDERDAQGNDLIRRIMNDEAAFIVRPGQSLPKPASTGQPYIIDKLYQYKISLENEALTFIGVDNIGAVEKKERLITNEVDSQNAVIDDYSDSVGDNLSTMCKDIQKVLGFYVNPRPKASPSANEEEHEQESEEANENEKL